MFSACYTSQFPTILGQWWESRWVFSLTPEILQGIFFEMYNISSPPSLHVHLFRRETSSQCLSVLPSLSFIIYLRVEDVTGFNCGPHYLQSVSYHLPLIRLSGTTPSFLPFSPSLTFSYTVHSQLSTARVRIPTSAERCGRAAR